MFTLFSSFDPSGAALALNRLSTFKIYASDVEYICSRWRGLSIEAPYVQLLPHAIVARFFFFFQRVFVKNMQRHNEDNLWN